MSSINTNASLFAISNLNANQRSSTSMLERLATGEAINRAADNPAGLIATGNHAARLTEIQTEIAAIGRTESNLSIKDGTLGAAMSDLGDLGSLVLQSGVEGGLSGSQLGAIQTQINGALGGIDHLASSTGIDVLGDVTTEMIVGTDEATGEPITETVSLSELSSVIETDPEAAQRLVDGARDAVVEQQAALGAESRAKATERRVLEEEQVNLARAYSRTRDTDYARESSALIRSQILEQASMLTVLASNQRASTVMSLLNISG